MNNIDLYTETMIIIYVILCRNCKNILCLNIKHIKVCINFIIKLYIIYMYYR